MWDMDEMSWFRGSHRQDVTEESGSRTKRNRDLAGMDKKAQTSPACGRNVTEIWQAWTRRHRQARLTDKT